MKRIKLFIILSFLPMGMFAQLFGLNVLQGNSEIVETTLENSFVVVQQQYLLKDTVTGQKYGYNHRDFYGENNYIGIQTKGGLVFLNNLFYPWSQAQALPSRPNLIPELCNSIVWSRNKESIVVDTLITPIAESNSKLFAEDVYSYESALSSLTDGLCVDSTDGKKEGWLILLKGSPVSIDSITIQVIKKGFDLEQSHVADVDIPNANDILGGFFVTPQYVGIGELHLLLSGILTQKEGVYQLIFPFVSSKVEAKEPSEIIPIALLQDTTKIDSIAPAKVALDKKRKHKK